MDDPPVALLILVGEEAALAVLLAFPFPVAALDDDPEFLVLPLVLELTAAGSARVEGGGEQRSHPVPGLVTKVLS